MIEEYLLEAFIRDRLANARRAAVLYEALRELEPDGRRPGATPYTASLTPSRLCG
jgi:hypothetical protein